MKSFFETVRLERVHELARQLATLEAENVPLEMALGRTLAGDLRADQDLPGFDRSSMDGYAVQSRDSFGVSESSPGYLRLVGDVVMGRAPGFVIDRGECARIFTGGMLPAGADAVIQVEHTRQTDERTVEVVKAVAPGTSVMGACDDARAGQVLLTAGHRLRPQDVGLLASLGVHDPVLVRRPKVGIISTGDEVVPVDRALAPGQVRDVNAFTLAAQVREAGAEPVVLGLVGDDAPALVQATAISLDRCDLTLLSGGSSVGLRDMTRDAFLSFEGSKLLVHGVSVSPGKPFIWVQNGRHPLCGLPGQVASCMVAFHLFAEPMLERMLGREPRSFARFARVSARLGRNVSAPPGREVYLRVALVETGQGLSAEPLLGKSGLLRTFTQGHGIVRIPLGVEGLLQGADVTVMVFP